jgi:two-component sensor histidine kinase
MEHPTLDNPVVEAPAGEGTVRDERELLSDFRLRQQEILAELGVFALQGATFIELLNKTASLTAEGLRTEFCKVLEYLPAENRLLVRAGVGWDEGVIGSASVGADLESPAGYALHTGKPVISNHLADEQRFRTPELLAQNDIRRAMNVILQGDGSPFGVLEVDSKSDGEFSERDLAFLQGAANVLGMAIERQRNERQLTAALARQKVLIEEINHRAKNSLQLVSGMLTLQAKSVGDAELGRHLTVAAGRVSAVGRLYARLTHDSDFAKIDLGHYLRDVCRDLAESGPRCEIHAEMEQAIRFDPERAIHLALIVNELVTNACKYAYADDADCHVWVRLWRDGSSIGLTVRDEGIGLPVDFDAAKTPGLGMRIVTALSSQLGATFTASARVPGTEFLLVLPSR